MVQDAGAGGDSVDRSGDLDGHAFLTNRHNYPYHPMWSPYEIPRVTDLRPDPQHRRSLRGKLFAKTCGGCHSIGEGARGGFGPELNGIIGRPAGTTPDYQYSDAMKNSGVVWTREKLAAYIEAPKKVVSGTRMIFWGISDQEKIDNILAYLATFQPE